MNIKRLICLKKSLLGRGKGDGVADDAGAIKRHWIIYSIKLSFKLTRLEHF